MAKKIIVEIDENGDPSIDLIGFNGKGCAKVLEDFAGDNKAKLVRSKPEINQTTAVKKEVRR
jgi:hypothetical protein